MAEVWKWHYGFIFILFKNLKNLPGIRIIIDVGVVFGLVVQSGGVALVELLGYFVFGKPDGHLSLVVLNVLLGFGLIPKRPMKLACHRRRESVSDCLV